jgi:hypothetical protein
LSFEYERLICSWPHRKGPQTGPRGCSPGCSQAGEAAAGANRRRKSAYRLNRRHTCLRSWGGFTTLFTLLLASPAARAAEGPFLITYTHQMEEPGGLGGRHQEHPCQTERWEPVLGSRDRIRIWSNRLVDERSVLRWPDNRRPRHPLHGVTSRRSTAGDTDSSRFRRAGFRNLQ